MQLYVRYEESGLLVNGKGRVLHRTSYTVRNRRAIGNGFH